MKNYNADNIQSLNSIEHIRLRPSMYIGDINLKGLHHLIYEILNNSIDEYLAGFCKKIWIKIHYNNFITISDNGRGIPIDFHKKAKKSALELVMTKIGAGGKFDKISYKISGGLHGVGLSCVNALSSKLIVKIYRNGKIYKQKYSKGRSINKIKILGKSKYHGTKITFKPDKTIFNNIIFNYQLISKKLKELSFLNKGISIFLIDKRKKKSIKKEIFFSKGGLKEFLFFIEKKKKPLTKRIIYIKKNNKNLFLEIVMRYNSSFKEKIVSYVNNINTPEGGTYVTGFKRALTRIFKKYIYSNFFIKKKIKITGKDIREGLISIISLKISNPQFEGQTKNKLGNQELIGYIDKIVGKKLNSFLKKHTLEKKKIIEKIFFSAKTRQAAKKIKIIIKKKNILNNSGLPHKLADCISNNPKKCELYLVEGDSAGGTAKQGRNRYFQAILPLRGKILNVEKSVYYKIFENEEIQNLFSSLGITIKSKKKINIKKLRYKKIIIMTDADSDGSHICTLILTFFFRYTRILIEKGYIYIATPPLYLINFKKKKIYAWNEKERKNILKKIGKNIKINIQRYKGLGEMNSNQLWNTTMNPKNRILRQININNFIKADKIFSMLMGDNVIPRKKFIEKNALYAKIDT